MQKKIWYYEKWVGRHASFPPRRSVKVFLLENIGLRLILFKYFFLSLVDVYLLGGPRLSIMLISKLKCLPVKTDFAKFSFHFLVKSWPAISE